MIVEGRKNGKTTEIAALELALLIADGEGAPEIYNIATKREQAAKAFDACVNMRKQSPEVSSVIKKRKMDLYFRKYGLYSRTCQRNEQLGRLERPWHFD